MLPISVAPNANIVLERSLMHISMAWENNIALCDIPYLKSKHN
jgi:hypothetical protein